MCPRESVPLPSIVLVFVFGGVDERRYKTPLLSMSRRLLLLIAARQNFLREIARIEAPSVSEFRYRRSKSIPGKPSAYFDLLYRCRLLTFNDTPTRKRMFNIVQCFKNVRYIFVISCDLFCS